MDKERLIDCKCKFCGSTKLSTEVKNTSTGLYCSDCGKWQKWLSKDEVRAFNRKLNSTYVGITQNITIENRLREFIVFLDGEINRQITREKLSVEDNTQACVYAYAYAKDKNALLNILEGKRWNENG